MVGTSSKSKVKNTTGRGGSGAGKSRKSDLTDGMSRWVIAKFIVGIIIFFIAIFLLLAFTSFVYSGQADCSMVEELLKGNELAEDASFSNACGLLGAESSFFLINRCFGLAAYFIPIFLLLLGLRMIGSFKIKTFKVFIIMGLCMLWTSIFLCTPIMDGLFDSPHFVPGGENGIDSSRWLQHYIGVPGLYAVVVLAALFMLIYFSTRTIEIVRSLLRMSAIRKIADKARRKREDETTGQQEPIEGGVVDTDTGEIIWADDKDNESKNEPANLFDAMQEGKKLDEGPIVLETKVEDGDDTANLFDKIAQESSGKPTSKGNQPTEIDFEISNPDNPETTNIETIQEQPKEEELHIDISKPYDPHMDLEYYNIPPFSLLEQPSDDGPQIDMEEQNANKEQIIKVLHSFGVEISSIKATIGPTITLYEITPAEGMRISRIRNLEDDIALSLAAEGIRIIAPIPGKGTIGIEVPNKNKGIVSMDSVLESKKFQETTMELPCALGKTITNEVFMIDLAKAPHLLVAGATGMGKSVGLNAIVTSLLYKKHPSELKIVMVDPKKVEFSIYSPIENHFLAKLEEEDEPIITDVQHVVKTLNSLCQLMDTRYDLLKRAQVRTIKEYNEKFKARQLDPRVGHAFMPYYVVVIDEFGDLIMTAGKEVELPICRIAQLARAVGIHMIIATQRPTTNIITGTIKANFPARIAFRVTTGTDSRTILDRSGANQLIGRGDMLYLQGGDPVRVQCAFIDTPEVSRICKYISTQQGYSHAAYLPEVQMGDEEDGGGNGEDLSHLDPMFAECAKLIVSKQMGSTSLLQRQFSIGYNRAGRLMDQMEKAGVVGPQVGSKPREVLIQDFNSLDRLISSLM